MRHLESRKLPYFTYTPKSLRPVNAVIQPLPEDIPTGDMSDQLVALGFSAISVRQLTATKLQPKGGNQLVNLSLFLVTLSATRSGRRYSN